MREKTATECSVRRRRELPATLVKELGRCPVKAILDVPKKARFDGFFHVVWFAFDVCTATGTATKGRGDMLQKEGELCGNILQVS